MKTPISSLEVVHLKEKPACVTVILFTLCNLSERALKSPGRSTGGNWWPGTWWKSQFYVYHIAKLDLKLILKSVLSLTKKK